MKILAQAQTKEKKQKPHIVSIQWHSSKFCLVVSESNAIT